MKTFTLYSAQTGSTFGAVQATSEMDALNQFARRQGFESAQAMWRAGRFEYVSAAA